MVHGVDGVAVVADDNFWKGKQHEGGAVSDEALLRVLQLARESNIKLNKDKL